MNINKIANKIAKEKIDRKFFDVAQKLFIDADDKLQGVGIRLQSQMNKIDDQKIQKMISEAYRTINDISSELYKFGKLMKDIDKILK